MRPRADLGATGACPKREELIRKVIETCGAMVRLSADHETAIQLGAVKRFPLPPKLAHAIQAQYEAKRALREHIDLHGCDLRPKPLRLMKTAGSSVPREDQ